MRCADLLEAAWGIIANSSGGDWKKETIIWQTAAARWRDETLSFLPEVRQGLVCDKVKEFKAEVNNSPSLLDYYQTYGGPARKDWDKLSFEERGRWVNMYDEYLLWLTNGDKATPGPKGELPPQ